MANMLCTFILYLIHTIIYIYSNVLNVSRTCYYSLYGLWKSEFYTVDLKGDGKSLNKLPNHLGIILTDSHFTIGDIASIIVWSIGVGIPYISVYDRPGYLKLKQCELKHKTEEKQRCYKSTQKFRINTPTDLNIQTTDVKCGTKIVLLGSRDCPSDVVKAAKQVATCIKDNLMKHTDINTTHIDCLIQEQWGFPDPDLVIKCGKVESLLGYLPWQTRLTEILTIPTVQNINYRTYLSTLQKYAGTSQRFGK